MKLIHIFIFHAILIVLCDQKICTISFQCVNFLHIMIRYKEFRFMLQTIFHFNLILLLMMKMTVKQFFFHLWKVIIEQKIDVPQVFKIYEYTYINPILWNKSILLHGISKKKSTIGEEVFIRHCVRGDACYGDVGIVIECSHCFTQICQVGHQHKFSSLE